MEKTQSTRPVRTVPFSRSPVDILIPFHSQYEKVSQLIKSILISVKSNPYQITLIDDCSENKSFGEEIKKQFLKSTPSGYKPQVNYIRSDKHLGFGGALKLGFEATSLPWILIMHSDCLVENSNFLINMGQSLLNWKKNGIPVKMVSAMSDNPNDCESAKCAKNKLPDKDIILSNNESLPLFCSMCHRDLFNYIGGFIKSYPYTWYENEELAFRMKKRGLQQGISSKSWIKHYGGSTVKYLTDQNPEIINVINKNRDLCLADMRKFSGKI